MHQVILTQIQVGHKGQQRHQICNNTNDDFLFGLTEVPNITPKKD